MPIDARRPGKQSVGTSKHPWPDLILDRIIFYGQSPDFQLARYGELHAS